MKESFSNVGRQDRLSDSVLKQSRFIFKTLHGAWALPVVSAAVVLACGGEPRQAGLGPDPVNPEPTNDLIRIEITPASTALNQNGSQGFTISGTLEDGSNTPVAVSYTAQGGTITTSGVYTAGQVPGIYLVIATAEGGLADTAVVTVSGLVGMTLTPSQASLLPAQVVAFQAIGQTTDGSAIPVPVSYSATGGSISTSGLFTAGGTPGSYQVIATEPTMGFADTADVTIRAITVGDLATVDFEDATAFSCGGAPCQFPWRRADLAPGAGLSSPTALKLEWYPGATGYTPVWVGFTPTEHVKIAVTFKLSPAMQNTSSNIKVWRISNPNRLTIFQPPSKVWGHYWEIYDPNVPAAFLGLCADTCPSWVRQKGAPIFAESFADNQWHTFEWELDMRNTRKEARFWFDGQQLMVTGQWATGGYSDPSIQWSNGTLWLDSSVATPVMDNLGLVEQFSGCCGNSGAMLIDRVTVTRIN